MLSEQVTQPTLDKEEFARLQKLRVAELIQQNDDDGAVANETLRNVFFAEHPYGQPLEGTPSSVASLTIEDVKRFHQENFIPNGSFLVIVGDIDAKKAISMAEKSFGSWKSGTAPATAPIAARNIDKKQIFIVDQPEVTQVQIRLAWSGIALGHPAELAIDLANVPLGGGFTSHLVDEIRVNAGLTYSVSSDMVSLQQGGYFLVSTFTKKETVRRAIDLALRVTADYAAIKPTEAEYKGAKAYLAGHYPLRMETVDALAATVVQQLLARKSATQLVGYPEEIKKLSQESVREAINTHFPNNKSNYVLVLVGPGEELKKQVADLGEITILPIGKHLTE